MWLLLSQRFFQCVFMYILASYPNLISQRGLLPIALQDSGQDPTHSAYSIQAKQSISCLPFLAGFQFTESFRVEIT